MSGLTDVLSFVGAVGGLFVLLEMGRRIGSQPREKAGMSTMDGAVFGLMALLIAFSFSGAATRFDLHRQLIVQETNAIGTAYLRVDLLPEQYQAVVREDFRQYVDARMAFYRDLSNNKKAESDDARATGLQEKIWRECVMALSASDAAARSLTFDALNKMIDITTTRAVALETHPPVAIYLTLVVLVMGATLLAGYQMGAQGKRNWTYMVVYPVILALAMSLIEDLEYPRAGLIRVDASDHVLMDLRQTM
jgi:NADH:ubiquinone oxidoreductase subunit 6 (subunit J)